MLGRDTDATALTVVQEVPLTKAQAPLAVLVAWEVVKVPFSSFFDTCGGATDGCVMVVTTLNLVFLQDPTKKKVYR